MTCPERKQEIIVQNHVLKYLNEIVKAKPDKTAYSDGTNELTFGQAGASEVSFMKKEFIRSRW